MAVGDTVRIRVYVTEGEVESRVSVDADNIYSGVQVTMAKVSGCFYSQEGIRITAEQTVVGSRPITVDCYAYDAVRSG